ncbi:MAG: uracil-DNA glycosylase family protein [Pseudomonadota bacterium]
MTTPTPGKSTIDAPKSAADANDAAATNLAAVVAEIKACTLCSESFGHEPRPIMQTHPRAQIAIFSQAPGMRAHKSGRPFDDPSGVRLREWLGVDWDTFYNPKNFFIAPMAFCFPGYDAKGGDKPPPRLCAETWRPGLMKMAPHFKLILLIGGYAQRWHLKNARNRSLTDTVKAWRSYMPDRMLPLPHPSWRNNAWLKKNRWFADELEPYLKDRVETILYDKARRAS